MRKTALDIGCGVSHEMAELLRDFSLKNATIIGVDWDFYFCKQSLERARKEGLKAEYVRCDAAFLPFQDKTFDVVCFLDSLRCLKGHPPEQFIKEVWSKLKSEGKVYITGLDRVCLGGKRLPIFKDKRFLLNWNLYVPINGSSPWISREPPIKKNYKYHGVLPHKIVSELLWRCGLEPETSWKAEKVENYKYYRYTITVQK